MTQDKFESEIRRLLRRVELLRGVARGDVKLRKIPVEGYYIKRHWVADHHRFIASKRAA